METRYKLCMAITILDWILIPLLFILIALYVIVIVNITTSDYPDDLNTKSVILIIGAGFIGLIMTGVGIGSVVCSIILLVKADNKSPNNGLSIAVGVCGIVFPLANLIMGIILCENLKHEREHKVANPKLEEVKII